MLQNGLCDNKQIVHVTDSPASLSRCEQEDINNNNEGMERKEEDASLIFDDEGGSPTSDDEDGSLIFFDGMESLSSDDEDEILPFDDEGEDEEYDYAGFESDGCGNLETGAIDDADGYWGQCMLDDVAEDTLDGF